MNKRKFKRILLHFGLDKTGSTVIQSMLQHSTTHGWLGTSVGCPPDVAMHARFGSVFCNYPEQYIFNIENGITDVQTIKKLDSHFLNRVKEWLKNAPEYELIVFSYEGFISLDVNALRNLKEFCEEWADIINIFLYVRPPLSYAVSGFSQHIKFGGFNENTVPLHKHKTSLEKVVSVFTKESIYLRVFERNLLKDKDVIADFLDVLGIADDIAKKVIVNMNSMDNKHINESLSLNGFLFGKHLAVLLKNNGLTWGSASDFYGQYGQHLNLIGGKERISLTIEQIDAILAKSKEHTEYLEQEFGITYKEKAQNYLLTSDITSEERNKILRSCASFFVNVYAKNAQYSGRMLLITPLSSMFVGQRLSVCVTFTNTSSQVLVSNSSYPINLSYHWLNEAGGMIIQNGLRTSLPKDSIAPKQPLTCEMLIEAPFEKGTYKLVLTLVREGVTWFEKFNTFNPSIINVTVVDGNDIKKLVEK